MKSFLIVMKAEILKQHQTTFHTTRSYLSLLILPIITFANTYYSYKPFQLKKASLAEYNSPQSILLFLIVGFLCFRAFWTLVQSAWTMQTERRDGTLEVIFQSPANKVAVIYGRVLGSLFENCWMFFVFSVLIIFFVEGFKYFNMVYLPLCFVILLFSAIAWGGLMNAMFLFSRNATIIFSICYEPMNLLAGVKIPTNIFPLWAKILSILFPLTHSLFVTRNLLIKGDLSSSLASIGEVFLTGFLCIGVTIWLLKLAENNARKNGNLTFY
jgi:ABC-2 type transport system permease protein